MFTDARSKKIVLVSHCILNQNAISDGTADYPGTNKRVVDLLLKYNIGIIQMPCPEILCLGLDRGDENGANRLVVVENTRIRQNLESNASTKIIKSLVNQVVYQIEEYVINGFEILGVIGVNRSPSCGVNTTSINNQEVVGEGVFIKSLKEYLEQKNINIEMIGIKGLEIDKAMSDIKNLLN